MRLAAFFLALAVALPAWANFQSLQILGWSADEQRFALRLYDEEDSEGVEEKSFCPGYVDHEGRPFRGSL
jgi:predicted secreted protein